MPHIEKIRCPKGIGHRVHWCKDGVRHRKYFNPRIPYRDVKRFADTIIATNEEAPSAPIKLGDLLGRYHARRNEEKYGWREAVAMRHLIRFTSDIYAHHVTADILNDFRDDLYEKRADGTELSFAEEQRIKRGVNNDLRNLRVIFRWARKKGIIKVRPFDEVEFFSASSPVPDVLTQEEMELFRRELLKPDRMIFYLLRYTGLRISEACALTTKSVDLKRNVIHLVKTKNREQVDIHLDARLERIWRWTGTLEKAGPLIHIKPDTVARHFRDAMTRAGIHKKMPTHIFRHTAGRRIMEQYFTTGNAKEIARRFLRHKTGVMTDHYAQIYTEDIGKAMDQVKL